MVTDLTEPPGDWGPRRPDWNTIVLDNMVDMGDLPPDLSARAAELQERANVLAAVQAVSLTPSIEDLVLTEAPFGLWQESRMAATSLPPARFRMSWLGKAGCGNGTLPRWMAAAEPHPPDAPVYMQAPGAAVFTNILHQLPWTAGRLPWPLVGCHLEHDGGDGAGRPLPGRAVRADLLARRQQSRHLRSRQRPARLGRQDDRWTKVTASGLSADHSGARYMAWMALGGTRAKIPDAILNIVGTTRVLGVPRGSHALPEASPNMLKLAQALCAQVIPRSSVA